MTSATLWDGVLVRRHGSIYPEMAITREQLYEQVWAEPMTKVAARHGVSATFLARVCERLNVPRPVIRYWTKLNVGKAPQRPGLPEAEPAAELEWAPGSGLPRPPRTGPRSPGPAPVPCVGHRGMEFWQGHGSTSRKRKCWTAVKAGAIEENAANELLGRLQRARGLLHRRTGAIPRLEGPGRAVRRGR